MARPGAAGKRADNAVLSVPRQRSKPKAKVENSKFAGFVRRIIAAHALRVAAGDVEALADLVKLSEAVDAAIVSAMVGLKEFGYSDAEVAARLGVTKQAVQKRRAAAGGDL
jgi:hypothetical protein